MLDQDILSFIRGSIRSVWALELLLLLRARPERSWSAEELTQELRASTPLVEQNVAVLSAAGLIRPDVDGRYAYAPASPTLGALCDQLEKLYRERPVRVVNAIVSSPNDKLQSFADAFRLKGDK